MLPIPSDISVAARTFGVNAALIAAIDRAEGNLVKAVQCGTHDVSTRAEAIQITCRSAVHAMSDFIYADRDLAKKFVDFWGHRWAPTGVENDPHNLNANWTSNVFNLWCPAPPPSHIDVGPDVPGGGAV